MAGPGGQSANSQHGLQQAASALEQSANTIRGIQTKLGGYTQDLGGHWEGDASIAFQNLYVRFNEDFDKVLNALQGMHEAMVHTRINYASRQAEALDAVNRVKSLLGG